MAGEDGRPLDFVLYLDGALCPVRGGRLLRKGLTAGRHVLIVASIRHQAQVVALQMPDGGCRTVRLALPER